MGCVHQSEKEIAETRNKKNQRTQKGKDKKEPKAVSFLNIPK